MYPFLALITFYPCSIFTCHTKIASTPRNQLDIAFMANKWVINFIIVVVFIFQFFLTIVALQTWLADKIFNIFMMYIIVEKTFNPPTKMMEVLLALLAFQWFTSYRLITHRARLTTITDPKRPICFPFLKNLKKYGLFPFCAL